MDIFNKANLIIYRFAEKGLEVFLTKNKDQAEETWQMAQSTEGDPSISNREVILLESSNQDQSTVQAVAIEGDWHDLPSLRVQIIEEARYVKNKLKVMFPEQYGAYVSVKEAFKKVMPEEYAMLKELKDILTDRNQIRSI